MTQIDHLRDSRRGFRNLSRELVLVFETMAMPLRPAISVTGSAESSFFSSCPRVFSMVYKYLHQLGEVCCLGIGKKIAHEGRRNNSYRHALLSNARTTLWPFRERAQLYGDG